MQKSYQHILVPVDDSKQAMQAFEEAVETAKRNNAQIYLMTAVQEPSTLFYYAPADDEVWRKVSEKMNKEAKNRFAEMEKQVDLTGIPPIKEFVTEGDPRQVIVHFAKKTGLPVDMIIMGATGKGSMERLLIGSTTTYVVNHADCNVLVVR